MEFFVGALYHQRSACRGPWLPILHKLPLYCRDLIDKFLYRRLRRFTATQIRIRHMHHSITHSLLLLRKPDPCYQNPLMPLACQRNILYSQHCNHSVAQTRFLTLHWCLSLLTHALSTTDSSGSGS